MFETTEKQCLICNRLFDTVNEIFEHMNDIHWLKMCPYCDTPTMEYNANSGISTCKKCGYSFGGKHVQTDEERKEEIKFLDEYIASGGSYSTFEN